jgi:hypothetical protein
LAKIKDNALNFREFHCRCPRKGGILGQGRPKIQKDKKAKNRFPAFAFLLRKNSKPRKIFFSFLKKIWRVQNLKKCWENFSVEFIRLWRRTQISSKFAGGSGAERKPKTFFKSFLGKRFELCYKFVRK